MKRSPIMTKLVNYISLLVTGAVIMALMVVGFYFNNFLKQNFLDNTREQMQQSFHRLSDNLQTIEKQLKGGVEFTKDNESLIASIDLINTYQDKNDYNTFLIDEEKKTIAQKLLDQVKLTFNSTIALYDSHGELQVYIDHLADKGYQLNYITFASGVMQALSRLEHEKTYSLLQQPIPSSIKVDHHCDDCPDELDHYNSITYQQHKDCLAITLHKNIFENDTLIAHLEITKRLDQDYFAKLSKEFGIGISFSSDSQYRSNANLMDVDVNHQSLVISETENGFRSVLMHKIGNEPVFFIARLDDTRLNRILKENRSQLLLLLVVIATVILLLMRFLVQRTIAQPLLILMEQVERIGKRDYCTKEEVRTGNELETISKSINNLALVIKEREEDLQKSVTQIRTIIETLPDLIWQRDAQGRFVLCNKKVTRLYGVQESELIGKTDYDLLSGKLADRFHETDQATIIAGKPCRFEEELIFADDGHLETTETIKIPMLSQDGKLIGLLGIGRDITERKRAEESLRRSQKMDAIGQLTGGIAHDFNNILAIIIGNIELLEMNCSSDQRAAKQIENIQQAAGRAATLTRQLLGFSRDQATEITTVDLNKTIHGMEEMVAGSLTPSIEVVKQFADDLWLTDINEGDFQDVLINLVLNGRDAMGNEGKLTIETCNIYLDEAFCQQNSGAVSGAYVQLAVSDNGVGIPRRLQGKVFEPFYTSKPQGKGTGLGLAMVFGFVKRSKGFINLYSEPGIGTTFRLYLPRSIESGEEKEKHEKLLENIPRGSETILVVDDEELLLELAQTTLSELGYRVLIATDGHKALKKLTEKPEIAILVSDVVMPGGMNGYELAGQATASNPQLKVLLCSGYTKKVLDDKGYERFSTNLLSKPYTQADLARRVRITLDRV